MSCKILSFELARLVRDLTEHGHCGATRLQRACFIYVAAQRRSCLRRVRGSASLIWHASLTGREHRRWQCVWPRPLHRVDVARLIAARTVTPSSRFTFGACTAASPPARHASTHSPAAAPHRRPCVAVWARLVPRPLLALHTAVFVACIRPPSCARPH